MSSAGKWILGLLLLVVGAVFIARTVTSDPGSQAKVKNLPAASPAGAAKDTKKVPAAPATDVVCKKACIEVNEVANDAVTTAKLAPGSVTLSKLAFEVPNLNELENEINARKAAEAATKQAQALALEAGAKNDEAITLAANNGITAEAAARAAADDDISKKFAAGDADLLSKLNQEMLDRGAGDDVLQLKLNNEIADRVGALTNLRSELLNPNEVVSPIVKINSNEIVNDAVRGGLGGAIKDDTITADDLANNAVIGRASGETLTNVKERTLRGERVNNTAASTLPGDIALGTVTGQAAPTGAPATGNIALGTVTGQGSNHTGVIVTGNLAFATVGRQNLAIDAVDANKLADDTVIGRADGETLTNVKAQSLRGQRATNSASSVISAGDLAVGTITGEGNNLTGASLASGNIGLNTIGRDNLINDVIDVSKLADNAVVGRAAGVRGTNTLAQSLRGQRETNSATATESAGDLALGTITGEGNNTTGGRAATGNVGLNTIGRDNLVNDAIDVTKIADNAVVGRAIAGDTNTNVVAGTLRGERSDNTNTGTTGALGDIAVGTITGQGGAGAGGAAGNIALGTITGENDNVVRGAAIGNVGIKTIGLNNLADAAVNGTKLAGGSVLGSHLDTTFLGSLSTDAELGDFALSLITPGRAVNGNDGFVDWTNLENVPAGLADGVDADGASALASDLAASGGTASAGNNLVSWNNLGQVPATFLNGTVDFSELTGSVSGGTGGQIADGTITSADLAGTYFDHDGLPATPPQQQVVGAVTSEKIADGSVELRDLAPDSVDSSKIADGSIDTADLKAGAVTADKITASVGQGAVLVEVPPPTVAGTVEYVFTPTAGDTSATKLVSTASITTLGTAAHKVLVTGQARITCDAVIACPAGTHKVEWKLLEDGVAVANSTYTAVLTTGAPSVALPLSVLRPAVSATSPAGSVHTYSLEVKVTENNAGASTFVIDNINLNAVDLGR